MATKSQCIDHIRIQIPSTHHIEVECVADPTEGLTNAVLYALSFYVFLLKQLHCCCDVRYMSRR